MFSLFLRNNQSTLSHVDFSYVTNRQNGSANGKDGKREMSKWKNEDRNFCVSSSSLLFST